MYQIRKNNEAINFDSLSKAIAYVQEHLDIELETKEDYQIFCENGSEIDYQLTFVG